MNGGKELAMAVRGGSVRVRVIVCENTVCEGGAETGGRGREYDLAESVSEVDRGAGEASDSDASASVLPIATARGGNRRVGGLAEEDGIAEDEGGGVDASSQADDDEEDEQGAQGTELVASSSFTPSEV